MHLMVFIYSFWSRHSVCVLHCATELHIVMAGIFPFLCFCAIIFASESQIVDNAASAIEYENVLTQNGYHFRLVILIR
jgi:hypothetical protein